MTAVIVMDDDADDSGEFSPQCCRWQEGLANPKTIDNNNSTVGAEPDGTRLARAL